MIGVMEQRIARAHEDLDMVSGLLVSVLGHIADIHSFGETRGTIKVMIGLCSMAQERLDQDWQDSPDGTG